MKTYPKLYNCFPGETCTTAYRTALASSRSAVQWLLLRQEEVCLLGRELERINKEVIKNESKS